MAVVSPGAKAELNYNIGMKNMWKERFDNCKRILVQTCATREHEVFSATTEAFSTYGLGTHRADAETSVEALGGGLYKIVQEAPTAGYWAQGYRCETLVKVYKRKQDTYVKLVESKRLRVSENPEHDGFIINTSARGVRVWSDHSIEAKLLKWLAEKVEL